MSCVCVFFFYFCRFFYFYFYSFFRFIRFNVFSDDRSNSLSPSSVRKSSEFNITFFATSHLIDDTWGIAGFADSVSRLSRWRSLSGPGCNVQNTAGLFIFTSSLLHLGALANVLEWNLNTVNQRCVRDIFKLPTTRSLIRNLCKLYFGKYLRRFFF